MVKDHLVMSLSDAKNQDSRNLNNWIAWIVVIIAVLWILHTTTQYFVMGVDRTIFMRHKIQTGFVPWDGWRLVLSIHVAAAIVALATGAITFMLGIFKDHWSLHRLAGRTYVITVVVSGTAGLPLAFTATGGAPATAGFLVLNCVWLILVASAFVLARKRDVLRHRVWAVRSYAVTFANMTLHLVTALLTGPLDSRTAAYTVAVWLCWPLNLCIAEALLRGIANLKSAMKKNVT